MGRYGGALLYVNSPKRLESLGDGLPPLNILITNTRVPKNTKALVAGVRALREALPGLALCRGVPGCLAHKCASGVVDPILASIDAISATFAQSASGGPVCDVGKLISMNQHLLCALGVGHPALDALVDIGVK